MKGDNSRVLIGGFSQGCMVSMTSLLRQVHEKPLGGVIGFSGVLPYEKMGTPFTPQIRKKVHDTPLFFHYGDMDHYFDPLVVDTTLDPIK